LKGEYNVSIPTSKQGDVTTGKKSEAVGFKSGEALLALKNEKGDFFVKGDILKSRLTFGCTHRHQERTWHSVELLYGLNEDKTQRDHIEGLYN